jgi:two-component system, chemotaxis family, chemotaxis protein CheY
VKVLVVDDSKVMRSIVMRTLRQAGFACDSMEEAADGASAMRIIESSHPDVVLTDWNMPGMPGIELLRKVRAMGDSTRIVFVTSEGTDEMRDLAFGEGANGFITKPFTPETFQFALGELIR